MSDAGPSSDKKPKMDARFTSKKLFDPETQDFAEISKKPTFVDHSLLNAIFFKTGTKLFVSAPKKFCKSSNMNMIRQFFEIDKDGKLEADWKKRPTYEIFKDKDIVTKANERDLENHLGAHPVLFVDLKGPTVPIIRKYEDALEHCYRRIKDAYQEHEAFLLKNTQDGDDRDFCDMWFRSKSLQDVDKDNVLSGLADLCKYLYKAHNKKRVLILIDECDAVIASALSHGAPKSDILPISQIMSSILGEITKGVEIAEKMVQAVLLTGVSYITHVGYAEDVKAVACRFLDDTPDAATGFLREKIIPFYGLHENQLDGLLNKLKEPLKLSDDEIEKKKEKIRLEFNGYHTKRGQCIYPLYVVATYLISGEILEIEAPPLMDTYQNVAADLDVASDILTLLGSGHIYVEAVENKINIIELVNLRDSPSDSMSNVFFPLLLDVGLLTYAESTALDDSKWKLCRLPNQTTIKCFLKMLETAKVIAGKFDNALQEACAQHICNLESFFLRRDTVNYRKTLILFYNDLKSLFKGFENQNLTENSENSLQDLMLMTLSRACNNNNFSNISTKLRMKDNWGRKGKIDIWMFDEVKEFAIIWKLKSNVAPADKTKTSIHALKEIRGQEKKTGRSDVVRYADIFTKRKLTEYFMVGLAIDEANEPSISIATSKDQEADPDFFICISTTEIETYKELYQQDKCCDLLHTS